MIKTVIFDFDGTLADCKKLHQDGFRAAVKKYAPDLNFDDEDIAIEVKKGVVYISISDKMLFKSLILR